MVSTGPLVLACALAALGYLGLSLAVVVGRVGHDRRRRMRDGHSPTLARARRLRRRARRHRTEAGRWRRVGALVALAKADHPYARYHLYDRALRSGDLDVAEAAVRALGRLAATRPWALDLLVRTLENGDAPRSRVATELDGLAPRPGWRLEELLRDERPIVRYWGVMLLARYRDVAVERVRQLVLDDDPGVRRAALETLGMRDDTAALPAVLERLDDGVMFVRAHACRTAGRLGGTSVAASLVPMLADEAWWVREATKQTLRGLGAEVASLLVPVLDGDDRFARNGAAEVLADLGVVDRLLREQPDHPLLDKIVAAAEDRLHLASQAPVELVHLTGDPDSLEAREAA